MVVAAAAQEVEPSSSVQPRVPTSTAVPASSYSLQPQPQAQPEENDVVDERPVEKEDDPMESSSTQNSDYYSAPRINHRQ